MATSQNSESTRDLDRQASTAGDPMTNDKGMMSFTLLWIVIPLALIILYVVIDKLT